MKLFEISIIVLLAPPLIKATSRHCLAYFGCAVADQDKNWALHVCSLDCSNRLNKWFAGGKPTLSFAVVARTKR